MSSRRCRRPRTAAAQAAGAFDAEIVSVTATKLVKNRETGEVHEEVVTLTHDEGNRTGTTSELLAGLKPVVEGGVVTAGNASQLSDGASACVLMDARMAERRRAPAVRPSIAVWPWQAARPRKWAWAPPMPCRACWSGQAYRSMISAFGN